MAASVGHSSSREGGESDFQSGPREPARNLQDQSIFWSVLQDSAKEALKNALGDVILGILTGQKMLENPEDAAKFTERLRTVFGASGAKTLEFVITKELYKRLGIPFDPDGLFDYAGFVEAAKRAFSSKNRQKNSSGQSPS